MSVDNAVNRMPIAVPGVANGSGTLKKGACS